MNGDTIVDLAAGDAIVLTDAMLAGFSFNLSGHTLTYTGGSLTLTNIPLGTITASAAAGGGVQLTVQPNHDPARDFNGDGYSDLMWRDAGGGLSEWLGQPGGSYAWNPNAGYAVGTDWSIKGFGDFDGDGRDDILWRQDATGLVMEWQAQAGGTFAWAANYALPTGFTLSGIGDFNGDGKDDLMWRDGSGTLSEWLGQPGGSFAWNGNAGYTVDPSWEVIATGDYDGDGKADLLWRQAGTSHVMEWLAQPGGTFAWAANYEVAATFHLAGSGDFNGDGKDDLLWRNDSGALSEWLGQAGGAFAWNPALAATVPTSLALAAVGDFNHDGIDDLLWRGTASGDTIGWTGQSDGSFTANPAASYHLPLSFDSQPHADHFL